MLALDPRKAITQYVHDVWRTEQGLPENSPTAIAQTLDGYLWLGTEEGLVRFDGIRFTVFDRKNTPALRNKFIHALHVDRNGSLWIGTRGGLNRLDHGVFTAFTVKEGLSHNSITSLLEDHTGSLWIGTRGGLNRLDHGVFTSFTTKQGLTHDSISSIHEDRDGNLWIGTYGGGLNRLDPHGPLTHFTAKDGLASDMVHSTCEDREGNLWIGTSAGLSRYKDGRFTTFTSKQGQPNGVVTALYEDGEGSLWIGTQGGGLLRLQGGSFTSYTLKDGLPNDRIFAIREDRDRGLWIGTYGGGLCRFKDGTFTTYTTKQGLSSDQVFSLHADHEGSLWIGTNRGGLNRFRDGRFIRFTTEEGLFNDTIFEILEDDQGRLWMSCNKGVFSASKKDLDQFADGKLKRISCTSHHRGCGRDRSGTHPPQHSGPPVILEGLVVNNELMPPAATGSGLVLSPGKEKFEFRYTATSLFVPQRVRFKYRLDKFDTDWVNAGTERSARYTHLPPREYSFVVRACNDDGVWNEAGARLSFTLQPHYYQTWWFALFCALALAALASGAYRVRVNRLLEAERVRARLAADLHDDVGSTLSQIAELPESDGRHREPLERMARISREAIEAMGDMVWAINPARDHVGDLRHRIGRFAAETLPEAGVDVQLPAPAGEDEDILDTDSKRETYLVAKEALNNVVKHAHARRAVVELSVEGRELVFHVKDDGRGFETGTSTDGNGLASMRRRAERVDGTFAVESAKGSGTSVTLRVPLRRRLPTCFGG